MVRPYYAGRCERCRSSGNVEFVPLGNGDFVRMCRDCIKADTEASEAAACRGMARWVMTAVVVAAVTLAAVAVVLLGTGRV